MYLSQDTGLLSQSLIAILGGSGGMGRVMAKLLASSGASIKLCGRNIAKVRTIAKQMGVQHGHITDIRDADIIIFSVPFEEILPLYTSLSSKLSPQSLIIDIASVKTSLVNELKVLLNPKMEYLSIHPLFGPHTTDFKGERILGIQAQQGSKSQALIRYFKECGLNFTFTTVSEHDQMMAFSQVLHHFLLITLGKLLADHAIPERYMPSSLLKTIKIMLQVSENWSTLIEIQKRNPYAMEVKKEYVQFVSQLVKMDDIAIDSILPSLQKINDALSSSS